MSAVLIRVLSDNKSGLQARLATTIIRAGGTIQKQERQTTTQPGKDVYSFLVQIVGVAHEIEQALLQLPLVHEVLVTQPEASTAASTAASAPTTAAPSTMAATIADQYPDFVKSVLDFQNDPTITPSQLRDVGSQVARAVVQRGAVRPVIVSSVTAALNKSVLPAIKPFSLAMVQGNSLQFVANPFARPGQNTSSACPFLEGFLEGLLRTSPTLSHATVSETACSTTGGRCTFTVNA